MSERCVLVLLIMGLISILTYGTFLPDLFGFEELHVLGEPGLSIKKDVFSFLKGISYILHRNKFSVWLFAC